MSARARRRFARLLAAGGPCNNWLGTPAAAVCRCLPPAAPVLPRCTTLVSAAPPLLLNENSLTQSQTCAPDVNRPRIIVTTLQKLSEVWREAAAADRLSAADVVPASRGGGGGGKGPAAAAAAAARRVLSLPCCPGEGPDQDRGRTLLITDEAHRHHGGTTTKEINE